MTKTPTETDETPVSPGRKPQPKCQECSHPQSFHGGKVSMPCKALGCHCTGLVLAEPA